MSNEVQNISKPSFLNKVGFEFKKQAPTLMIVGGIGFGIASTITACKATTKASAILEEANSKLADIKEVAAKVESGEVEEAKYSKKDKAKDLVIVYAQTVFKFAKLYGVSILFASAAIACILGSHGMMMKRNAGLAAAYGALGKAFSGYRKRVTERFGEEVEKELRYNIVEKEYEETVTGKDGKEKTVTKKVKVANPQDAYVFEFSSQTSSEWLNDPSKNLTFLSLMQSQMNDLLQLKGHLFLNEVLDALGMQRVKCGQIVGWTYDPVDNENGDNYVDFGILKTRKELLDAHGYNNTIMLNFNVDGDIWSNWEDFEEHNFGFGINVA